MTKQILFRIHSSNTIIYFAKIHIALKTEIGLISFTLSRIHKRWKQEISRYLK